MVIPNTAYARRIFFAFGILFCVVVLLARFVVLPYAYDTPAPSWRSVLDTTLSELFTSSVAAIIVAAMLLLLIPPSLQRSNARVISPHERGSELDSARLDTSFWWFTGGLGRYTRTVTLPELAKRARSINKTIEITLCILDPSNSGACTTYANYRSRVRTGAGNNTWTPQRVRLELYGTVLAALRYQQQEPLLRIRIALRPISTMFRYDVSTSRMVVTKEDPRDFALVFDANTFFYDSYLEELKLSYDQFRKIEFQNALPTLAQLDRTTTRRVLADLNLATGLQDGELDTVIAYATSNENPYA